jgi:hypothetical protein
MHFTMAEDNDRLECLIATTPATPDGSAATTKKCTEMTTETTK